MKKIISFSLAILMAFNQLPVSVLADNNGNQEIDRNPVVGFQAVRPFEEGRHPRRVAFRPLLAREGEEQFDGLNDRPLKALAVDDQKFRMQGEDFDDALALFSPDYAAAAIVKSVTAEDLQKLLRLPLEVGIAVIRGSIVMFTSGSANELRGNQAVKDLLAEASIMIHTHHEGSRSMPSALDFQEAGEQIEYAITMNGVYAYNHHGLVQQSPLTAGELIALIERVHAPNTSSYAARRVLNRFIVAVQDMNVHPEAAQVLRSADPLTVLPRAPIQIGTTGQASGGTAISFNTYHADYNLTNAPGWGGIFISWDDPATGYDATRTFNPANPPIDPATGLPAVRIIETIDLSSFLTNPNSPPLNLLSVNSNSTPNCVPVCRAYKIDFYDDRMVLVAGQWVRHKVSYYPPAYGDLVLTRGILAQLQSTLGLNLNRIQEIVIVAEAANTNPDIGYMNVTLGNNINYVRPVTGVAFNPATQMNLLDQWQQRPSLGLGTVGMTDIPGVTTEDKDGIFNVTQSNDRQFQIQYAMPDTEDFGFVSLGGYFNRQNQFVGAPQNFDGTYTIALSGPAGSSLNLEMTNTAGEKYISQLIMTGSTQLYTIALDAASVPPGFLSNSKQIANVVLSVNKDKSTGASCGTSSASLCTVNVYTRDMYYMPPLTLVPTATLTNFGGQATFSVVEPCTVRGENPCATNHIVNTVTSTPLNSASQYSFVYDLRNGNATDDPGTRWAAATLESNTVIDLTVPGSSIVMDVNSTTGHFFIEVQDTVNSLHVIKVEGRNGRFVITRASLLTALATETPTDFDFSRIRRFTFVADNANDTTGTITVSGLGLRYAQEVNGTTFNDAPGVLANFNQFFPNLGEFVNTPLAGQTPHSSVDLATPTVGTQFQLNFSVPNAGDFAGASLAGGAFDTTAIDPREIQIGFTDDLSGLTLSAQGQAGLLYNLEYSTHLAHWELAQLNMRADANGRLFAVDDGHLVTPTGILSSPFAIGNSSRTYRFRLAPNQPGTFVPAPSGGFRNLGNPFSLGIDGPAGQQLTVEVFSKDGRHQDFIVNLAGVARNYVFNLLSTFINPAEIAMINFVAKNGTATSGTVRVYANGMPYTVQVSGQTTGTITNLSAFNVRPGILNPTSGVIAEPYADNFRQVDDKTLNFDYAAVAEDFGGAIYVLGSDSNPDVGDDRFDTFYNMAANGDLVFKVSGVNSINVSISDDQLVKFVNGKPQYRSVTLNFTNLGTNPYIVIKHSDLVLAAAGFGVNLTSVSFVINDQTVPASGTLSIESAGLVNIPDISARPTGTITNLSAFNVRPGILNPTSGVIAEPYPDHFRQVDDKTLNFDYDAVAEDFGGAIYVLGSDSNPDVGDDRFDTFYNMTANGDLVFRVSGVTNIHVSVSDNQFVRFVDGKPQYRSVTLNFENINPANPYIVIKHSDLVLAAAGFGVNLTSVSFVINDQTVPASGTLSIESAGLVNIPDISARPTGCTTAAVGCITDLSDYKIEPGILNRVSGVVTRLAPTLGQETNAIDVAYTAIVEEFGGAIFVLGKNTEEDAKLDTFYPLNGDPDRLVFKVSGVTSIHVSVSDDQFVRFIDGKPQYRSVTLNFTGISAANPYVVITRADLLLAAGDFGVNLTSVSFVIDDQTVPSSGMVRIESLGLLPPPEVIPPDSTLRASDISTFPFLSWNIFDNDGPGSRVTGFLNPTSATQGKFIFNVSEDESFAGTVSSFDDPSTPSTIESASLSGNLTLGVSFDSLVTGQVQVEVEDTAGHRAKVLLDNVTDQEQFYRIALTRFLGVDLAHIKQVVLVVINGKVSDNTSALFVRLGNHPTIPGRLPNPTLTAANISQLPGIYGVIGGNGNINVINNTRFNLNFDVSAPGARAYSVSHTNNFGTTDIEFRDWSSSFPITVGLRLTQGTGTIIAEVQDADNDKAFINLFEVSGTEGFYQINLSDLPSYVDPARIVGINFVVANSNVTSNTGILEVRMGSHGLVNGVTAPVSAFNSANLVTLNGNPLVTSGGGNVGSADPAGRVNRLDVTSAQTFSYAYDIHAGNSSFAFARISNGSFNQSGVFTGTPINLTQNFSIAASGSAGNKVILLLRDTNNLVARYVLTLDTTLHNYAIDLSSTNVPAGFRRDSIGEIVFNHDRDSSYLQDVVNVMIKGVNFTAPVKTPEQQSVYNDLLAQGQAYFTSGNGIDAVSGLPLELINSGTPVRTTQPALIGLYAQILGENVGRQLTAQTRDQALAALNRMMDSLIEMQWSTGWNGLIPTALSLNTNPPTATNNTISLGENALLAQSLAVTMGSILLAQAAGGFTAAQTTQANNALNKINDFLEEQQGGYFAMVDNTVGSSSQGLFYTSVTDGVFSSTHIDHLATQYRGAIAFLLVRYPLARTVWDKLTVSYQTYVDRSGAYINNLALENGAASEMFGPLLRNSELDHIGFFSALQNHWLSQQDFAYQNNLMGFLSGVDLPGHPSQGQIGLPGAAWQDNDLIVNMGSPAAIAAGCQINFSACLNWMVQINTIAGMQAGPYGFFENARSQSEITTISRGTSIAATVLGLSGQSGAAFDAYLSSWGYAKRFNDLYDAASQRLTTIFTSTSLVAPIPEFPATSRTVFEHVVTAASGGSLVPTSVGTTPRSVVGYEFKFNALAGGTGNYQWVMDQSYDAQNNSFLIHYSTTDTPKSVVFQFRDAAGNILFSQTAILESTGGELRMLRLALPDQASLQSVRAVEMVVNQASDDNARADFIIRDMVFQKVSVVEPQGTIAPNPNKTVTDISDFPGSLTRLNKVGDHSSLRQASPFEYHLDYNLATGDPQPDTVAGINIDLCGEVDYVCTRSDGTNLSGMSSLVFGVQSQLSKLKQLTFQIVDMDGNIAIFDIAPVNAGVLADGLLKPNYYEFLMSRATEAGVDLTRIRRINFLIDDTSFTNPADRVGQLRLQIRI